MSDTPRTDAENRPYPSPEHAQRIRFEGCECVVMYPQEYEALYERARAFERELAAAMAELDREIQAKHRIAMETQDPLLAKLEALSAELAAKDARIRRFEEAVDAMPNAWIMPEDPSFNGYAAKETRS